MLNFLTRYFTFQHLKPQTRAFRVTCDASGQCWSFRASTRDSLAHQILSNVYGVTVQAALRLADQGWYGQRETFPQPLHVQRVEL